MKYLKHFKTLFGLLSISLFAGAMMSLPANAETSSAAQGLQISPALVELNGIPGNTYSIKLNVMNVTAADLTYSPSVVDFNSSDETGSPHIITDSKLPATASIRTWVTSINSFALRSGQRKELTAEITIPKNAEPGGHYGIIRFAGQAPDVKDTGVGLSAGAGTLILVKVDGKITEDAKMAEFFTSSNGHQSFFFESGPMNLVARVKNDGNIHIKPNGNIEVRDMFGGLVSTIPVNKDMSNVLPGSIRKFETELKKDWMFGRYTATITLGYGTTGQAVTSTISFWVIPYKLILIALLMIGALLLIFKRLLRAYNRNIYEKAKHEFTNSKSKHHSAKKDK